MNVGLLLDTCLCLSEDASHRHTPDSTHVSEILTRSHDSCLQLWGKKTLKVLECEVL